MLDDLLLTLKDETAVSSKTASPINQNILYYIPEDSSI